MSWLAVPRSSSPGLCSGWCDHAPGILVPGMLFASASTPRLSSPLALAYTSPDFQPAMNSSCAVLSEEVQPVGSAPRRLELHCLCGAWEAMWDIGRCSCNLWGTPGPKSTIWPVISSTCCLLSSNLRGSEPVLCLCLDFQSFKVNRIFLMI